jgi:hypothetical protein
VSDVRSLPDVTLKAYLYSLGAWGLVLLPCYITDRVGLALSLCYPLALWLGALTVWWWSRTWRRQSAGALETYEVASGVRSVGRILAGGAIIPGIIFLANDPLQVSAWGTFAGIAAISGAAFGIATLSDRYVRNRVVQTAVLGITWIVLPANATGAVSVATMWGWFSAISDASPI